MYIKIVFAFVFSPPYLQRFIKKKKIIINKQYHVYKFIPDGLI